MTNTRASKNCLKMLNWCAIIVSNTGRSVVDQNLLLLLVSSKANSQKNIIKWKTFKSKRVQSLPLRWLSKFPIPVLPSLLLRWSLLQIVRHLPPRLLQTILPLYIYPLLHQQNYQRLYFHPSLLLFFLSNPPLPSLSNLLLLFLSNLLLPSLSNPLLPSLSNLLLLFLSNPLLPSLSNLLLPSLSNLLLLFRSNYLPGFFLLRVSLPSKIIDGLIKPNISINTISCIHIWRCRLLLPSTFQRVSYKEILISKESFPIICLY